MSKISRKNHTASLKKWGGKLILQKMRDKVPFDNSIGWDDLPIARGCGHCNEVRKQNHGRLNCSTCSLKHKVKDHCNELVLSFTDAMYYDDDAPNFSKAEWHRVRLYNKILADEVNVYEEE
jgi:hypothetical protein